MEMGKIKMQYLLVTAHNTVGTGGQQNVLGIQIVRLHRYDGRTFVQQEGHVQLLFPILISFFINVNLTVSDGCLAGESFA